MRQQLENMVALVILSVWTVGCLSMLGCASIGGRGIVNAWPMSHPVVVASSSGVNAAHQTPAQMMRDNANDNRATSAVEDMTAIGAKDTAMAKSGVTAGKDAQQITQDTEGTGRGAGADDDINVQSPEVPAPAVSELADENTE